MDINTLEHQKNLAYASAERAMREASRKPTEESLFEIWQLEERRYQFARAAWMAAKKGETL